MELRWPTDRIDYVPITERQPLPLPDGAKLIVWPCVNVEHWVISEPMPRTVVAPPGGAAMRVPDIPNWAWHEYGQRVGFWRLKAIEILNTPNRDTGPTAVVQSNWAVPTTIGATNGTSSKR